MRFIDTMAKRTDSLGVVHTLAIIRRNDGHRMTAWVTTCNNENAIHRDLSHAWNASSAFERELNEYIGKHNLTLLH